ncbi:hypothetical protein TRFO_20187 [Tritrichomonas foetus]|uniref:Uncharacterized protein n=1 Tax=Tritrichomonas foetus TaxID=1144522 RepID=A0A1J4KHV4_9EUKA|nr:hypothetical protein TRFO_20187 [Tritrichomonas foetus]|eukprot:OHT10512.1 hypothetical protein TRFO_20187 [Tritrichomonas foetus]
MAQSESLIASTKNSFQIQYKADMLKGGQLSFTDNIIKIEESDSDDEEEIINWNYNNISYKCNFNQIMTQKTSAIRCSRPSKSVFPRACKFNKFRRNSSSLIENSQSESTKLNFQKIEIDDETPCNVIGSYDNSENFYKMSFFSYGEEHDSDEDKDNDDIFRKQSYTSNISQK